MLLTYYTPPVWRCYFQPPPLKCAQFLGGRTKREEENVKTTASVQYVHRVIIHKPTVSYVRFSVNFISLLFQSSYDNYCYVYIIITYIIYYHYYHWCVHGVRLDPIDLNSLENITIMVFFLMV